MIDFKSFIESKKMVIIVGTGGVGKTTLSAALAIKAAQFGKKTLVLTIDPAKRLAQSLGIREFSHIPTEITLDKGVKLSALMIDTKHSFDSLVKKYADPKAREKILNNRIYHHLSSMMATTEEYMALEKLYEIHESKEFDLVVLDTPPAKHALSFLEASDRLANFLDENVIKWFLMPKFLFSGSYAISKIIERITGIEFLRDLSEFLVSFQSLYAGFRERTLKAKGILKDPNTVFFLVTNPEKIIFQEALKFYQKLDPLHISLGGVIINRIIQEVPLTPKEKKELELLVSDEITLFKQYQTLAHHEKKQIQEFRKHVSSNVSFKEIPFFEKDIHDIKGLERLNEYLF